MNIKYVEGGVNVPRGFKANGVSCGLKKGGYKDIAMLVTEKPALSAVSYTENRVKAHPVLLDMERTGNMISAVIANSGNANCLTGEQGEKDAQEMASLTETLLGIENGSALVASTGIIGQKLEMNHVKYGIEKLVKVIAAENNIMNFSHAIMTTDTKAKNLACEIEINGKKAYIGISAKGAGMICPRLSSALHATMLVFITTDVSIGKQLLQKALDNAIEMSFNRISVDNDTSTNDSVFLLANGMAENETIIKEDDSYKTFESALCEICMEMSKLIVKDGEGTTKLIKIDITGAKTEKDAKTAARTVADSYLVKTAIFGQSPNWGRIISSIGYSGVKFDVEKVKLYINGNILFENGESNRANVGKTAGEMIQHEILIKIDLQMGNKEYYMWTSDLSFDYVKINANYLT